jgi:hypothetical protein
VQIEQQQNRLPFPAALARQGSAAAEHVALFPTRLALARWMQGGDIPHVISSDHDVPMRAAWYAQAQNDFQAWLEDGGFHAG